MTSPRWYGEEGEWVQGLNEKLRERPSGHAEPTDQDRYYDDDTRPRDTEEPPPWLDLADDDREAEL